MASEKNEDDKKPASGGSSKLVVILMLLNFVGIAGVGAYLVLFGDSGEASAEAQSEEGEEGEAHDPGGDDPYTFGPLLEMEPIIVNMSGQGWGRFIRVTLHLELRNEEQTVNVQAAMVPVRNRLVIYFSELDPERTRTQGGKEEIREELVRVINDVIGAAMVRRVYYSEFVVQ